MPGDTCKIAVSTSTKPCASNHARVLRVIAVRACRNGLRSACRDGAHHGEGWSCFAISDEPKPTPCARVAIRAGVASGYRRTALTLFDFFLVPGLATNRPALSREPWRRFRQLGQASNPDLNPQQVCLKLAAKHWLLRAKSVCCSRKPLRGLKRRLRPVWPQAINSGKTL